MTTLEQTDLKTEHRDCITAIDVALSALQDALDSEKSFRKKVRGDHPEFYATLPGLKFPIVLSTNPVNKPYQMADDWRQWVRKCGCLKGGE